MIKTGCGTGTGFGFGTGVGYGCTEMPGTITGVDVPPFGSGLT